MDELTVGILEAAWTRVAENAGGPGVDGVTVERFAEHAGTVIPELLAQMHNGEYVSLPQRKLVVQKKPGSVETRTLHIPAVRDRVAQTAVARVLSKSFEEEFLDVSYAYRANRGVDRAVARIQQLRDRGYEWVVDADITAYFDNIPHKPLLDRLAEEAALDLWAAGVLKQWVKAAVWDGRTVERVRRGIAQGSPISPLLANFYLTPLDIALSKGDHKLIRYADDLLILCKGQPEAEKALGATATELKALGLELKTAKTRITSFEAGFKFLGVRFLGREAMIPWKAKARSGTRVVFMAHPMTGRQLRQYRESIRGKEKVAAPERPAPRIASRITAVEEEMAYLYVTQPGAVVRKSGDRFLVEADGEIVVDTPYHRLEHILIFGNVQITSQAMAEALDHNIALSLFSRQGRFRGSLTPPAGQNVVLRLKQYAMHQDPAASLAAARECIRWKIENALTILERYEERGNCDAETKTTLERAEESMTEMQSKLDDVQDTAALLGYEGAAARSYFDAFGKMNRSALPWTGREKHPAKDPMNSLLSFTYTLVLQELMALLGAQGLDPALGFLHEIDGNRPSLALDLFEPFRSPVADRLVLTMVNRGMFSQEDFEQNDRNAGLYLRPGPQREFFAAYERWMLTPAGTKDGGKARTFRSLLGAEADAFSRFLREGGQWSPFSYRSILGERYASDHHV